MWLERMKKPVHRRAGYLLALSPLLLCIITPAYYYLIFHVISESRELPSQTLAGTEMFLFMIFGWTIALIFLIQLPFRDKSDRSVMWIWIRLSLILPTTFVSICMLLFW